MTPAQTFIETMRNQFAIDANRPWSIEQTDIDRHTGSNAREELGLYNEVAQALATGFHSGDLTFEFCDAVVNGLYAVLIEGLSREPQQPWPDLFYQVFVAFDEGEYRHKADAADVDPIAKYTKPMIGSIVAEF